MAEDRRSSRALAALLPAGALGLSISLASADAAALATEGPATSAKPPESVAGRLQSIREDVSAAIDAGERFLCYDADAQLAWWGNGGWRNGGWRNWGNGWGNGGWHNWGNGWGNGGWHNWGNGWHNW